jgi:hypothetical protein
VNINFLDNMMALRNRTLSILLHEASNLSCQLIYLLLRSLFLFFPGRLPFDGACLSFPGRLLFGARLWFGARLQFGWGNLLCTLQLEVVYVFLKSDFLENAILENPWLERFVLQPRQL